MADQVYSQVLLNSEEKRGHGTEFEVKEAAKLMIKASRYTGKDVKGYFLVLAGCLEHMNEKEMVKFTH